MDGKICTFCGHRTITESSIEKSAEEEILRLVETGYTEFYTGGMGEFDLMCGQIVRQIKRHRSEIHLCLILPYMSSRINDNGQIYNELYDDIIIPDLGDIHYKRAITERNKWMVDRSDILLAYVTRKTGGAYTTLKYAVRAGKKAVNLGLLPNIMS